uniref:Uncharacterized protein n=1 Tax=Marinomonas sp. (strain MWYL1) TaxID=400668 RepID=A6VY93_MARMS
MIENPIVFTEEQLELIEEIKNNADFSSNTWSCDQVTNILKPVIREHYTAVQNATCPYCQMRLNSTNGRVWDVEHIIPKATVESFMFEPLNLCVSCVDCNNAKSNKKITDSTARKRYPRTGYFFVHPHFDNYHDNIHVVREGLFYFPKTDKGEKTIYICKLCRFYSFAGYDDNLDDLDDRIVLLANSLTKTKNERTKDYIRRELRELVIRQGLVS